MITGARQHEDDVATVRLAQAVDLMANERNPERLCEIALEAARELCGADGGEVVRLNDVGAPETCAQLGQIPAEAHRQVVCLMAAGVQLGALSLWGEQLEAEPGPVIEILGAQLAQALATERLGRRAVEQRGRARRLARAVRSLRDLDVADRGLGRLVDASCTLVGGVGGILVSAAAEHGRIIAGTGLDPVAEQTLAGLVATELSRLCVEGRPWSGALPTASPLRELGVVGVGLVVVRGEDDHTLHPGYRDRPRRGAGRRGPGGAAEPRRPRHGHPRCRRDARAHRGAWRPWTP